MAFANAWSSDVPAVETKGGTGNAAYVVGDMLYSDATNNLARRAIGTNGQVLTVVAGVPNWAVSPAAGPGSMTLLNSTTVSDVAFVSWGNTIFTNDFDDYYIRWFDVITHHINATDAYHMRFSSDNGATWLSGTNDYGWKRPDGATQSTGYINLGQLGTYTDRPGQGFLQMHGLSSSTVWTQLWANHVAGYSAAGTKVWFWTGGTYRGTSTTPQVAKDAVQFFSEGANISGTWEVYGVTF